MITAFYLMTMVTPKEMKVEEAYEFDKQELVNLVTERLICIEKNVLLATGVMRLRGLSKMAGSSWIKTCQWFITKLLCKTQEGLWLLQTIGELAQTLACYLQVEFDIHLPVKHMGNLMHYSAKGPRQE
ncbi:hypothetical protein ACJX0J_011215 [Zea mays]